ncbi:MAG: ABC transporter ATP-binding protein [Alphaproteobacteria bacterium]|nr:ABC transporter ATP-binding protein [Alphaproteobacteria bacterium]
MKIIYHYLKPFKSILFVALILAAINQIFSLFDPMLFGKLIDEFAKNPFMDKQGINRDEKSFIFGVLEIIGLLICTAMVSRIAKAFQDYFVNLLTQKFGAKIFTDGLQKLMYLPYQQFENKSSGETLSSLTKVRADTEKFIISFINILFSIIISVIFVTIYAIHLNWIIIPVFVLGSALLSLITNYLSKKIKKIQKKILYKTNRLAGSTTESIRNIELIKSVGLVEQEINRLNLNTYQILELELQKVKRIRSLSFIQGTLVNMLRQIIVFVLVYLIFKGQLTIGEMISLQFYSFFIFGPLQELGQIIMNYREAEASLINFDKLMKLPQEIISKDAIKLPQIFNLKFEHVSFKHQTMQTDALKSILFDVKKGETIAFVGPSGAGKTTLVKLLVGLYQPVEGQIKYNDIDSKLIHIEHFRTKIGFVTQDTQLFAGTIKDNLLFVNPEATLKSMELALQMANCQSILNKSDLGINSYIGEGGIKLSGGEKQRLAIARALLRNPELLILDEATSAMDSLTEGILTQTIQNISNFKDKITIIIAHRLSTIMQADKIYVLEKGHIVETGNHAELISQKGLYFAMWRQQIGERIAN